MLSLEQQMSFAHQEYGRYPHLFGHWWNLVQTLSNELQTTKSKLRQAVAVDGTPRAFKGEHIFLKHRPGECQIFGSCPICDGGLAVCVVCDQAEGELQPVCPGRTK